MNTFNFNVNIYIYIYIHCHPPTDCFVVSQLFSVTRHVGRLKLGSKPTQLLPARPTSIPRQLRNYKVLSSSGSSSVHLFTFYTLPDTRVPNSLKSLTTTTQECCEQYWTGPGGNTPQSSSYTATYYPSRKLSKLDDPDMRDTAGEVGTSS